MINKKFRLIKIIVLFVLLFPCIIIFSACSNINNSNVSITISTDGYWVINGTKTNTKAEGTDGINGEDGKDAPQYTLRQAYNELVLDGYQGNFSDFLKEYFDFSIDITSEVANVSKPSIVSIVSGTKNGSGVIIEKDNQGNAYILTNFHVTYGASEYKIYLADDDKKGHLIIAKFVDGDEDIDLAILKVENNNLINNTSIAKFANLNAKAGETCIAIGNTHSKGIAVSIGTISKSYEEVSYNAGLGTKVHTVLRHCAYIAKGSSGGGLFNLRGELIGITNAGEGDDDTLMNYAIPIEIVSGFVNKVMNNL